MYIRTENHIYLIHKDISYGGNKIYKIYNHDFSIIGNDFKVADTIEELCDEYVYVRNKPSLEKPLTSLIRDLSIIDKVRKKSNTTVYGCIWTEWGLKYVAKMNESGDLELI